MAKHVRAAISIALILAACADPALPAAETDPSFSAFDATPKQQWRLPSPLNEISGLAASIDGRLFAHDDERAVIYELDPTQGRLVSTFTVGAPETGDFEGLAITPDGAFWLTTSRGELLTFRQGQDGERVAFERFDSGLRDVCEVEGLAYLPADESLILACKRMEGRAMRGQLQLYAWRPGSDATPWRSFRGSDVARAAGVSEFQPSSLEIDASTGDVFVLSANDGAVARFGADGALRNAWPLSAQHAQAEGLTFLPDGSLVITDEGASGPALLSIYERRHD
jgi:uncharacterized protein YjiK